MVLRSPRQQYIMHAFDTLPFERLLTNTSIICLGKGEKRSTGRERAVIGNGEKES